MSNISKISNSEICQTCAKCCKIFIEYVDFDTALRLSMLDTNKITVKEIIQDGVAKYQVTYHYMCNKLKQKDGKWYCELYNNKDKPRPSFCREYPDNMSISMLGDKEHECPLIQRARIAIDKSARHGDSLAEKGE